MKGSKIRTSPLHRKFLNRLMLDCALKGLSLSELAWLVGVAHQTVYSWINENSFPSKENYNKLADFFDWPKFKE